MKLRKMHWVGIVFGAVVIVIGLIFFLNREDLNLLFFLVGIALGIIALPFVAGLILETRKEQEINQMFLEFSRNLAESVTTGTPVSKSIVNMRKRNYGPLSPHVRKMANQIELGIPVERTLQTFAYDIGSPVISRAVGLISEAEKAGGEIDYILESVAKSISEIEKLKKERRAAIYNLVVQGYIIFFIFIGIMLVMEFKILPLTEGIGSFEFFGGDISKIADTDVGEATEVDLASLGRSFLYLLLVQGLFAGLTIGKLAEGSLKAGIKHSFILMIAAFLISTGAKLFLG
tara:strand:- start:7059 stop:7925 length:867 start_codon:yes stop_codon:yes gene_type:complete